MRDESPDNDSSYTKKFIDQYPYNSSSEIDQLKKDLVISAQAGLDLLEDNNKLKEELARYFKLYNSLLEELSEERQRNLTLKSRITEEYEEKIDELQNCIEKNKKNTSEMIKKSKPYQKLSRKYEQLLLTTEELRLEIKHYENIYPIRSNENNHNKNVYQLLTPYTTLSNDYNMLTMEDDFYKYIDYLQKNNDILQDEMKIIQNRHDYDIMGLKQKNKMLQLQNMALEKKLELTLQELESDRELSSRAIDSCKSLSIQLVQICNENTHLKNQLHHFNRISDKD